MKGEVVTVALKANLNEIFNQFGVYFEDVLVMNVRLPGELRHALQTSTTYDVHLQYQQKVYENSTLKLNAEENKALATLKRENMQEIVKLQHDSEVAGIEMENTRIVCDTHLQTETIKAQMRLTVNEIKAEGIKTEKELKARAEVSKQIAESRAYEEGKVIYADAKEQVL